MTSETEGTAASSLLSLWGHLPSQQSCHEDTQAGREIWVVGGEAFCQQLGHDGLGRVGPLVAGKPAAVCEPRGDADLGEPLTVVF